MATVLVVDDLAVNRDLVAGVLGHNGHHVLEASDGVAALALIRNVQLDLMITDELMPGMDGYELTRRLRENPATAGLPVIFYTANYLEEEARPIAAAVGVSRVVSKSGDPMALVDAVDEALTELPTVIEPLAEEDFGRAHLRVLNTKLVEKLHELEEKNRLQQLVEAAIAVGGDLSLPVTLRRIVEGSRSLVDARYAALGVLGEDHQITDFIHSGIGPELVDEIGPLPTGHGVLGVLIQEPVPLRLAELADHTASAGFPPHHPAMRSFLGVPVRVREQVFANLYMAQKNGAAEFTSGDQDLLVAFASAAAVAIGNAQRYDDSRRRQAWLSASAEITSALLAAAPAEALDLVARGARRVADADVAWIEVRTDNQAVVIAACDGPVTPDVRGRIVALDEAHLFREVSSTGRPMVIDDAAKDGRLTAFPRLNALAIGPLRVVPLVADQRTLGALMIGNEHANNPRFNQLDVEMATTFASHAALALEFAQAQADREHLTVLADRDRIARDLHDLVIQRIFAAGMSLQSALALVNQPEVARRISAVTEELDATITDLRTTIFQYHGGLQQAKSTRAQLLKLGTHAAKTLGFAPRVIIDGPVDTMVPEAVAEHLVAVVSEALSNIARHAGATSAEVSLHADQHFVTLLVTDNGRGMGQTTRESGLRNMRDRAELLGGTFTVTSTGAGAHLEWRVPLDGWLAKADQASTTP
jgi:signal transduction histidine kinase/CheY-like chemotaxis protein